MSQKGNEKFKDNIFRYLFSNKENFVNLYYDLTGKKLSTDELEFYDTESLVVKPLRNDIAFKTIDNRLIIMAEHQSTLNENMPLRFLLYYADVVKMHILQNSLNIYSKKPLSIPIPEFYVFYNGEEELTVSQMYLTVNLDGEDKYIYIMADIIDINHDKLVEKNVEYNDVLAGYSYLMGRIRYYVKHRKLLLVDAIEEAIRDSKSKGYLQEYLERKEFITMVGKTLTMDEYIELIRKEEREEGREAGEKLGIEKGEKLGIEKGEKLGRETGEKMMSKLIERLAKDNRTDDIIKVAKDVEYRKELYKEYNIISD